MADALTYFWWILGFGAQLLLILFNVGISWLINRIFKMTDDLRTEDELIRQDLSRNYVRRDDYQRNNDRILDTLNRIENKLDGKADKNGRSNS